MPDENETNENQLAHMSESYKEANMLQIHVTVEEADSILTHRLELLDDLRGHGEDELERRVLSLAHGIKDLAIKKAAEHKKKAAEAKKKKAPTRKRTKSDAESKE
jgi:hypothetical protein